MSTAWRWLDAHAGEARFGFVRRDGTGLLGAGIDERIDGASIAEVLDAVQRRGGSWFVGGCFDPASERAPWWRPFGAACAWRPRETLEVPGLAARSTTNGHAPGPLPEPPPLGAHPDRSRWERMVDAAADSIARGTLEKVVLARSIVEQAETDALGWLARPRGARDMAFLYEPVPGVAFAGSTPELLFERRGHEVTSEALAGTDVDTHLGRQRLLASEKDAREHGLVVEAVSAALAPLCMTIEHSELQLAVAGGLVHRLVAFRGELKPAVSDAHLAGQLHPTPAVAGAPSEAALSFLRAHEPFDRGWYAGPVGLVDEGRSTLAVALRCGLWRGDTRIAYAGAGLVEGSKAQAEWDETELKSLAVRQ